MSAHSPGMCGRDRGGGCSILALTGCLPLPGGTADPVWTSACTSVSQAEEGGAGGGAIHASPPPRYGVLSPSRQSWLIRPAGSARGLLSVPDPVVFPVKAGSLKLGCSSAAVRGPGIRAKGLLPSQFPDGQPGPHVHSYRPGLRSGHRRGGPGLRSPAPCHPGVSPSVTACPPCGGCSPVGPGSCCSVAPNPGLVMPPALVVPPPAPSPRTRVGGRSCSPFLSWQLQSPWLTAGLRAGSLGCDPGRSSQVCSALCWAVESDLPAEPMWSVRPPRAREPDRTRFQS